MKPSIHFSSILLILSISLWVPGAFGQVDMAENVTPVPTYPQVSIVANHKPIKEAVENASLFFKVTVNHPEAVAKVVLNFRDVGRLDFNTLPMGYNPASEMFEIELDERYHTDESIEYYIEVYPRRGNVIRMPAEAGAFYTIKTYRKAAFYMRPILLGLLILSPVIIAGIIGRIYRLHVKRTTEYQQKLRRRQRQLAREREKHYKQYLEKLTGSKTAKSKNNVRPSGRASVPRESESPGATVKPVPPHKSKPIKKTAPPRTSSVGMSVEEEMVSTGELRRELDEILSHGLPGNETLPSKKTSATSSVPSREKPARKASSKSVVSEKTRPGIVSSGSASGGSGSKESRSSEQTQPVPPLPELKQASGRMDSDTDKIQKIKKIRQSKKTEDKKEEEKKGGLEKSERDKLLDILGLDI